MRKTNIVFSLIVGLMGATIVFLVATMKNSSQVSEDGKSLFMNVDFSKIDAMRINDEAHGAEIILQIKNASLNSFLVSDKLSKTSANFDLSGVISTGYSQKNYRSIANYSFSNDEFVQRTETIGDTQVIYKVFKNGTIKVESVKTVQPDGEQVFLEAK